MAMAQGSQEPKADGLVPGKWCPKHENGFAASTPGIRRAGALRNRPLYCDSTTRRAGQKTSKVCWRVPRIENSGPQSCACKATFRYTAGPLCEWEFSSFRLKTNRLDTLEAWSRHRSSSGTTTDAHADPAQLVSGRAALTARLRKKRGLVGQLRSLKPEARSLPRATCEAF